MFKPFGVLVTRNDVVSVKEFRFVKMLQKLTVVTNLFSIYLITGQIPKW